MNIADENIGNLYGLVAVESSTEIVRDSGIVTSRAYEVTDAKYIHGLGVIVAFKGRWHALAGGDGLHWFSVVNRTDIRGYDALAEGSYVEFVGRGIYKVVSDE